MPTVPCLSILCAKCWLGATSPSFFLDLSHPIPSHPPSPRANLALPPLTLPISSTLCLSAPSSKPRTAPSHHVTLTHQFGIELAPIKSKVNIEVDTVESALGGIHSFKVLFKILSREITCQSHDFLDTWIFGVFCTGKG